MVKVRQGEEVHYCCWDPEQAFLDTGDCVVAIALMDSGVYASIWLQNHEVQPLGSIRTLSKELLFQEGI